MAKPQAIVELQSQHFDSTSIGSPQQLVRVLDGLEVSGLPLNWVVVDAENVSFDRDTEESSIERWRQNWRGTFADIRAAMVQSANAGLSQFIWLSLLAWPHHETPDLPAEYGCESDAFTDIGTALLEVRAFDTTYIEVYSASAALLQPLASAFNARVESEHEYRQRKAMKP
jgi:hypothetical protein